MANSSLGKKLKMNIVSGLVSQFVVMVMGILVPRLVLVNYGSEVNGFLNSISQVFACMEVLEAGIGTATLQALFKYIGKEDRKSVNGVLSATTVFYNRVGIIYSIILVAVAFLYPFIISSSISFWTMFAIIMMQGIPSASSYFVQAKFKLLLSADGQTYIQNNISLVTRIVSNAAKIFLIYIGYGVLEVQFAFFLISMMQIGAYKVYEKKNYKWVNYKENPDFDAIKEKKNVFVHQISGLIYSNTDSLILAVFCNLKVVSVYSMYNLISSMVGNIISSFSSGVYFYLGQTFNLDRNRYLKLHDLYETYYMGFVFSMYTTMYVLIGYFFKIYTRGIDDINYIDPYIPLLIVMIKFLETGRGASLNVLNFSKMFKQTQHQAVIEMLLNIVVSLVGVHFLGIYGVLIGTIVALLYRGNVMIYYANKKVLNRSCWITYRRWIINFSIFIGTSFVFEKSMLSINSYPTFFLYAISIMIVTLFVYFSILSLFERKALKLLLEIKPWKHLIK